MRTFKTLAVFGALLLAASTANASIIFTLHAQSPDDGDPDTNVQVDMFLSEGQTVSVMGFNWLFSNGTPVGPGPVGVACGTQPNSGCDFPGMEFVGSQLNNPSGQWIWNGIPYAVGGPGGTTFTDIGLFTLTGVSPGTVFSVGEFEIFDTSFETITDITVYPIPEPTTAALLGLGLAALGMVGRATSRDPSTMLRRITSGASSRSHFS